VVSRHLDAEAEIRGQRELYYPCAVIVEDKANGPAIIRLQINVLGVVEINPKSQGCSPRLLSGKPVIGM